VERALATQQLAEQQNADEAVAVGIRHIRAATDSFTLREIFRELSVNDRIAYLIPILGGADSSWYHGQSAQRTGNYLKSHNNFAFDRCTVAMLEESASPRVGITIVATLNSVFSIAEEATHVHRMRRLEILQEMLRNIHVYLRAFDPELALIYARDSGTMVPDST
jgi:hypothetical protein